MNLHLSFWVGVGGSLSLLFAAAPAVADPGADTAFTAPASPAARTSPVAQALGVAIGASNFDTAIGRLEYRLRWAGGTQLGVDARGSAVDEAFVAGQPASGGESYRGLLFAQLPLVREGPLELDLRAGAGARHLAADSSRGADTDATAVVAELGPIGSIRASEVLTLRAGVLSPFSMQVNPETDLDVTGALLVGGLAWALSDELWLHLDVETGGIFDSDAGEPSSARSEARAKGGCSGRAGNAETPAST